MPHDATRDPNVPPREEPKDVEETINPESEVDEASFESFPASDPPTFMGKPASRVGPADFADPEEDEGDEEEGT